MLQRMNKQELDEPKVAFMEGIGKTDIEEIFFEDREFLKIMNKNSKMVGKHYEFPYHWKIKLQKLSNNR